ncbi:MAG TPA: sugar phosphate nucleotidyltransferase [Gammaproteobacteria bacterium]|jgi:NDP-sugar pyrophosphorylase family protein|nr:sugar phosphate nucleotidyltransferase [Gammaproteobacteria bacterium]
MSEPQFPVVILAGGLATRLRPITEKIPKSLIPINGEPFIAHQLRLLAKNQFKEVVMCIGFLGEQIVDFVGDGQQYGLSVHYAFDGPELLGTAGAIKKILPDLSETFYVLYGDSYLPCPYVAAEKSFLATDKTALMTVFRNLNAWDASNVLFENNHILNYDKVNRTPNMQHIDYGLGIFQKKAFDHIPTDTFYDLALLYQDILKQNQLAAFEIQERFYEVGSHSGIQELENFLSKS